ncbi:MAG: hypothetical protein H6Q88_908, partial [Anaeromyxobacteraceae bacterium]|nr:hypothetical protein [Anaeromyxobacteraceae bacterium]
MPSRATVQLSGEPPREVALPPGATVEVLPSVRVSSADVPGLVAASRPRWVVFPVGAGNRYGFPHEETVARWRESGAGLLRTDDGP